METLTLLERKTLWTVIEAAHMTPALSLAELGMSSSEKAAIGRIVEKLGPLLKGL